VAKKRTLKKVTTKSAPSQSHSFEVGKSYLIRTVTMYHTGRLVRITDTDLVLEDAAWIAYTGQFSVALKTGVFSEVEPFVNPVIVSRGAIVDATIWDYPLPESRR
jgi:hypothetical protein